MIHTCRKLPKFKLFVRKLRPMAQNPIVGVESVAVGILERLWHFSFVYHRDGNVGQSSNAEIADSLGWKGDPGSIIQCLVESDWLEETTERLSVVDWNLHSKEYRKPQGRRPDLGTSWWRSIRKTILERDDYICQYCDKKMEPGANATVDHVVAFSNGGTADASNLVAACRSCNSRKGDR